MGRLHVVHEDVYAVGHSYLSPDGRLIAAVLAFPLGAALSHRTAAERRSMLPPTTTRPHVSSAARTLLGRPGIVLHRCRSLAPELMTVVDGIRVTTVERTLIDLAGYRDTRPLERAWHQADRLGVLDVPSVARLCDNSPGRRVKPVRLLIERAEDAPDTRSELEHRFADLIRAYGLPAPAFNVLVEGYVVDAVWHEQRVIVELDSRSFHGRDDESFEGDRIRIAELQLVGYRVYPVTWRELTRNPDRVAGRIERMLATPLPRTGPSPTPAARAGGA